MNNEENRHSGPLGMGSASKARDFKGAIKRLCKELNPFKILIFIALLLAVLGAILSIIAPNKLSKLTDEISDGLVIKKDNLTKISKEIQENLNEDTLKEKMPLILDIKLDEDTIKNIMQDEEISSAAKEKFNNILPEISTNINVITELDSKILEKILPDSKYNGITVTTADKISLLNMNSGGTFTQNLAEILLTDITIDDTLVTKKDQSKFINIMSEYDKDSSASELYSNIDKMPESIQELVKPKMDIKTICSITIFLASLYFLSALFTFIESLSMSTVSNKFAKSLREKISKKINHLPLKYFDKHQTGDILSRITNDVDQIAQSMNMSLSSLVSAITLFLGTIIMMFVTNWIMAITAIVSSLFGFLFMALVLSKSQKYFVLRQTELGNLNGHIEEIYSGLNVVKAYNGKEYANEKFDIYNKKVYDANRKSQFLSGLMMPMMNFIGNFGYVAVCIVGALLTLNGQITFGVIVAFITYVRLFTSPLSQIAQGMTQMQSVAAASERVFEFLDEEEMVKEKVKTRIDKEKVVGNIEFDHVSFKYDGNDKPTINDFSAFVRAGNKVAIVGPTGAGKTTMVNLLERFYEINEGDIKIDGISTKDLTRENIHELFTMVLQDTWLFEGTIKENIKYNQNISDEKVKEVSKIVGLHHFIKTLPNGYDSLVSDSDSISAGQRQLLTIARAMTKDSPFLILDEATSNVDTRSEELVQKAMDKLTEGKTSFIIAHRLSTIKNADIILVMKNGNIIEQGNHEELMKQKGFYADLYNSQFEL